MTTSREAEAYLDAVREELADLTDEERGELLEDLAQHIADIASDDTRAGRPLVELLGEPSDYVRELRTAAGLPSRETRSRSARGLGDRLRRLVNESAMGRSLNGPRGQAMLAKSGTLVRELMPAWWVARGVLVVGFFVLVSSSRWQHLPVPIFLGSRFLGLLLIVGAVAVSIHFGRRGYAGWRRVVLLADAALALVALSLLMEASLLLGSYGGSRVVYVGQPSADVLESVHGPVTNIYPYDRDGRPLEGVLLYDQDGRPLRVARQHWWADGCERQPTHPLAADGVPVEFSYPVNYTVSLDAFGPASEAQRQRYEQMLEQRCSPQISRPVVPIPTFPAPAASTTTTATPAQPAA